MLIDHWPLLGLRLITPRLELRLPSDEELSELADLAAEGMHGPGSMPFLVSWPSLPLGTHMRAAALHLAFAGLDATDAVSGAFDDNVSSLRVSEKLGYQPDGIERLAAHGRATTTRRLRLTRDRWQATDHVPVTVTGLAPCRPLFGLHSDDPS